jgi:alpha-mannosidase
MKKVLFISFIYYISFTYNFILIAQEPKRLYLGNDTHVDLMYNGTEKEWDEKIFAMTDFYLKLGEDTKDEPDPARRSKWNYDCAYWLYTLEKHKSPEYFARVIDQIKRQQASVPYNFTLPIYGAFSPEMILRSFYYGGYLERKYGIDVDIAVCQENATIPLGLSSLWAGSGAAYSWKGVCYCATKTQNHGVRDHEMYYYKGLDGQKILMKWYSILGNNAELGGYSELLEPTVAVIQMDSLTNSKRYPYRIAGAFGKGWDNMWNFSYDMVWMLNHRTRPGTKLFISNELDFFKDFEATYGSSLPSQTVAWGNEWDLLPASLTSVSSGIRRAMEKLRSAEAMAALVTVQQPKAFDDLKPLKDNFMYALSVISAHGWTLDGPITKRQFADWAKVQHSNVNTYVDSLYNRSQRLLGNQMASVSSKNRFYVFNQLNWNRSDVADIDWAGNENIVVKDLSTGQLIKHQFVIKKEKRYLRIWAENIPSVGYKTYEIVTSDQKVRNVMPKEFTFKGLTFETPYYQATFTKNGVITSLIEKISGREVVNSKDGQFINDLGSGNEASKAEVVLTNIGPLSATLVFEGDSPLKFRSSVTFYVNSPKITFDNEILQNFEKPTYWTFSINAKDPQTTHEEVGAIVKAAYVKDGGHYANRMSRVDHLSVNHFADVQGSNGGAVVSNRDCLFMKLGKSEPQLLDNKSGQLNFLVGGQIDADKNLGIKNQDGDSYFENHFALLPHITRFSNADAMKFSLEDQNPFACGPVAGKENNAYTKSFLQISDPNMVLWALKPGEDGGVVARTWNMAETPKPTDLRFSQAIKNASLNTHVETKISDLPIQNNSISILPKQQQMQTIRVEF